MSTELRRLQLTKQLVGAASKMGVSVDALFLKASILLNRYGNELSSDDWWLLDDLYDPDFPEYIPESERARMDRLERLGMVNRHSTKDDYGSATLLGLAALILWLSEDRPAHG